ncbi:MAG: hypothetical protein U0I98_07515, partial [Oscillospiraceae bacterium]|nr:hypothetical protein [Oscillospiraceae bacterium]
MRLPKKAEQCIRSSQNSIIYAAVEKTSKKAEKVRAVPALSLSKNAARDQAGTAHFKQLLKKRAKKQKKSELFQLHVANFFRFMHANLSVTQFVTR